jgi:hypothetical protein
MSPNLFALNLLRRLAAMALLGMVNIDLLLLKVQMYAISQKF